VAGILFFTSLIPARRDRFRSRSTLRGPPHEWAEKALITGFYDGIHLHEPP
jgi:hypothetical protein